MKALLLISFLGLASCHPHSSEECELSDMSPFGCFDINPSTDIMMAMQKCYMNPMTDLMGGIMSGKIPQMSAVRESMAKALECKYNSLELIEGDMISKDMTEEFVDDLKVEDNCEEFKRFSMECFKGLNTEDSIVKQAVEFEVCVLNNMIEKCEMGKKSTGALPFMTSFVSLAYQNSACKNVKVPKVVGDTYEMCLENPEENKMEMKGLYGMKKEIFDALMKVPVLQAICCTGMKLGLHSMEEGSNFTALAIFVEGLPGVWESEVKKMVLDNIYDCGVKAAFVKGDFDRDMAFLACFLPKHAATCGFENELTTEFLLPFLNSDRMGQIANSIKEMTMDSSPLRSFMNMLQMKAEWMFKAMMSDSDDME